jgi:hypothetical protein
LWQETRDTGCKKAVNWVSTSIRHMTRKKALERWETKLANTELTPPAIWPIAKSLTNRVDPRAPVAIHGLLGLKYHPVDKANATATAKKTSSHRITCEKKTMNGRWRLKSPSSARSCRQ